MRTWQCQRPLQWCVFFTSPTGYNFWAPICIVWHIVSELILFCCYSSNIFLNSEFSLHWNVPVFLRMWFVTLFKLAPTCSTVPAALYCSTITSLPAFLLAQFTIFFCKTGNFECCPVVEMKFLYDAEKRQIGRLLFIAQLSPLRLPA